MNKKGLLGNLIGGFVVIVIAVALIPNISVITDSMLQASNATNISGGFEEGSATNTLLKLVPLFFALAMAAMGFATIFAGLRNAGIISGGSSDEDDDDDEDEDYDSDMAVTNYKVMKKLMGEELTTKTRKAGDSGAVIIIPKEKPITSKPKEKNIPQEDVSSNSKPSEKSKFERKSKFE